MRVLTRAPRFWNLWRFERRNAGDTRVKLELKRAYPRRVGTPLQPK